MTKHILALHIPLADQKRLCELLEVMYQLTFAETKEEAQRLLGVVQPQLLLVYAGGSMENGATLVRELKESVLSERKTTAAFPVPVLFYYETIDDALEAECFMLGAQDFIVAPFQRPAIFEMRLKRILDAELARQSFERQVKEYSAQLENYHIQMLCTIAETIDARSVYTRGHSMRVAEYSAEIARRLGWTEGDRVNLYHAALLHDIGYISVSDSILNKQEKLTEEEYAAVRHHTELGEEILCEATLLEEAVVSAKYHHERYDGAGYCGLSGEEIPLSARIIGLADAIDAMASARAYRGKLHSDEILTELQKERGKQFDPELTDVALSMLQEDYLNSFAQSVENEAAEERGQGAELLRRILNEYKKEFSSEVQKDPLTGVLNRRYTEEEINVYLQDRRNAGVMFFLDLDNFKAINDTYGHLAGDELLREFAELLREMTRQEDIIGRVGGDEFVLFLKGSPSVEETAGKADRILRTLRGHLYHACPNVSLQVSMGIATSTANGRSFEELYVCADHALYYVKNHGKHGYHFYGSQSAYLERSEESKPVPEQQYLQ